MAARCPCAVARVAALLVLLAAPAGMAQVITNGNFNTPEQVCNTASQGTGCAYMRGGTLFAPCGRAYASLNHDTDRSIRVLSLAQTHRRGATTAILAGLACRHRPLASRSLAAESRRIQRYAFVARRRARAAWSWQPRPHGLMRAHTHRVSPALRSGPPRRLPILRSCKARASTANLSPTLSREGAYSRVHVRARDRIRARTIGEYWHTRGARRPAHCCGVFAHRASSDECLTFCCAACTTFSSTPATAGSPTAAVRARGAAAMPLRRAAYAMR
jgi:hypothetical protein